MPLTPSQALRNQLLAAMGPERHRVATHPAERPEYEASVWVSNNRAAGDGKRICVCLKDGQFFLIEDLEPNQLTSRRVTTNSPFSELPGLVRSVLEYLLGDRQ